MRAATIVTERDAEVEAPGRGRRSRLLWLALGAVVLAGAGSGYWFLSRDVGGEVKGESAGPVATAEVSRETISATESWGGTLGHGSPFTVTASGAGTVTRIADQESKVKRGSELYRLNEQPVIALYGAIPMYRDLASGDSGVDVEQLEANLAKLGYDGFDVDDDYTWYTALAVREWQDDIGAEQTGVVRPSDMVFMPAGGRVDTLHVGVGGTVAPGTAVLDVTGAEQVVSLEVDVVDRDMVKVGTDVTVGLPGGEEIAGTVTAAAVVEDDSSEGGGGDPGGEEDPGSDDTVTEVEVTLDGEVDESLLGSPVDVVVDVDQRENVLVVPVIALLALAEGGYGLEVVAADGSTSIVPVKTGLFADGKVEVEGAGIGEGTVVGVAGR